MTYSAEARPNTNSTETIMETNELKILGRKTEQSLLDNARIENIRTTQKYGRNRE